MTKHISTDWVVYANNVRLSRWAFDVQVADEKEQIDVSGFNPLGTRELLPGLRNQTVTVQFVQDRDSGGPYATLIDLYTGGSAFPFFVQPDSDSGTSGTNPLYGGTASIYSFPASATLNQREEFTATFAPAPNSSFQWGTTAPGTPAP